MGGAVSPLRAGLVPPGTDPPIQPAFRPHVAGTDACRGRHRSSSECQSRLATRVYSVPVGTSTLRPSHVTICPQRSKFSKSINNDRFTVFHIVRVPVLRGGLPLKCVSRAPGVLICDELHETAPPSPVALALCRAAGGVVTTQPRAPKGGEGCLHCYFRGVGWVLLTYPPAAAE